MRRVSRLTVMAVVTGAVLCATIQMSSAATDQVRDPRGDARSRIDIRGATFHNRAHAVVGVIDVARLRPLVSRFSVSLAPLNSPDIAFVAHTIRRENGTRVNRLIFFDDIAQRHVVECDLRAVWDFDASTVKIRTPRSCLMGVTGTLHMGAQSRIPGTSDDRTRFRDVDQG